ncbi:MAG: bifunctional hydroxymethylpyrimidine kinase/phosphomethylpyrimidine kinase [Oscillospiraceae bacterium]|jgi:pyridoxine kinase|nr:bifunctional hydroxymethylpyrimidine kinase/phosphomethylpyrimidine kinase [Oscillospiraceae bacterium]
MPEIKRVAVINDICGLGRCSLAAALPVLSVLGVQPCPVPTTVLSNQTGYDSYALLDCEPLLRQFPGEWRKRAFRPDAISTGFFASVGQVEAARALLHEIPPAEDGFLLVDPVLGDNGAPYPVITPPLFDAIAALAQKADILTPNVTEACLLAGERWDAFEAADAPAQERLLQSMGEAFLSRGAKLVAITGWRCGGEVRTVLCSAALPDMLVSASPALPGSYSGTGDLFAAALCGLLLRGTAPEQMLRRIARFLEASLAAAAAAGVPRNDGVPFEPYLSLLLEE